MRNPIQLLMAIWLLLLCGSMPAKANVYPITVTTCNDLQWNLRAGIYDEAVNPVVNANLHFYDTLITNEANKAQLLDALGEVASAAISIQDILLDGSQRFRSIDAHAQVQAQDAEMHFQKYLDSLPTHRQLPLIILQQLGKTAIDLTGGVTPLEVANQSIDAIVNLGKIAITYNELKYAIKRATVFALGQAMKSFLVNCGDIPAMASELGIELNAINTCRQNHPLTSAMTCPAYVLATSNSSNFYHPEVDIVELNSDITWALQLINNLYQDRRAKLTPAQMGNNPAHLTSFIDVPRKAWFYDYVETLRKLNIVSGRGHNMYLPNEPVNRSEFLKMLIEAYQLHHSVVIVEATLPSTYNSHINSWRHQYLAKAYTLKNAMSNNEPVAYWIDSAGDPGTNVTRGEAARMLMNAKGYTQFIGTTPYYSDVPSTHPFYPWVMSFFRHSDTNILKGYADGTFKPDALINRAEAAKIIYQAFNLSSKVGGVQ